MNADISQNKYFVYDLIVGNQRIYVILRTCVILGWDYYAEILRQDLHPTIRLAPNHYKSSIIRQDLHPTAIRVVSYDKTCTQAP